MIKKFYEKNKTAGLLQIPYIIWTLFDTYLNFGVYLLIEVLWYKKVPLLCGKMKKYVV